MPAVDGRYPQVSGLCFTYDISAPAGSRVRSAVRQAVDGSCTGAAVDLTTASTYKIAENDFMACGGDGYPVFPPESQRFTSWTRSSPSTSPPTTHCHPSSRAAAPAPARPGRPPDR